MSKLLLPQSPPDTYHYLSRVGPDFSKYKPKLLNRKLACDVHRDARLVPRKALFGSNRDAVKGCPRSPSAVRNPRGAGVHLPRAPAGLLQSRKPSVLTYCNPRLSKKFPQALRTDKIWPARRSLNFSSSRLDETRGFTGLFSLNLPRKTCLLFLAISEV